MNLGPVLLSLLSIRKWGEGYWGGEGPVSEGRPASYSPGRREGLKFWRGECQQEPGPQTSCPCTEEWAHVSRYKKNSLTENSHTREESERRIPNQGSLAETLWNVVKQSLSQKIRAGGSVCACLVSWVTPDSPTMGFPGRNAIPGSLSVGANPPRKTSSAIWTGALGHTWGLGLRPATGEINHSYRME